MVYEGADYWYTDLNTIPGTNYYYYVVSYDDGSQDWSGANMELESGKFWTWTGWGYYHGISPGYAVTPAHPQAVDKTVPAGLGLGQNVPNPFNPTTTISYSVPKAGEAKLVIYNQAGQVVRTLIDGTVTAGQHRVVWNGTDNSGRAVATGVYVYRLSTDDGVKVRRMTMVK